MEAGVTGREVWHLSDCRFRRREALGVGQSAVPGAGAARPRSGTAPLPPASASRSVSKAAEPALDIPVPGLPALRTGTFPAWQAAAAAAGGSAGRARPLRLPAQGPSQRAAPPCGARAERASSIRSAAQPSDPSGVQARAGGRKAVKRFLRQP